MASELHRRVTQEVAEKLAEAIPEASVGVTGSVARGEEGPGSDVDLVLVRRDMPRQMQFLTLHQAIPIVVACLRTVPQPEAVRHWRYSERIDGSTSFLLGAVHVAGPPDPLNELQAAVRQAIATPGPEGSRRDVLLACARQALRQDGSASSLQALSALLGIWRLDHGVTLDRKYKSVRLFKTIAERDPPVSRLLCSSLPILPDAKTSLASILARLAGSGEDDDAHRERASS